MKSLLFRSVERVLNYRDSRTPASTNFPSCHGKNYFFNPLFPDQSGNAYFYKFFLDPADNPLTVDFKRYRGELLPGKLCRKGRAHQVHINTPSILPYSIVGPEMTNLRGAYQASIKINGKTQELKNLLSDRFYYLSITEPGQLEISSEHDLIVGKPIHLTQGKKHKQRLVMTIFVDSFAWEIFDQMSFEDDLPNIHKFFSKGMIFENAYSSSNWTVPSVASIFSGRTLKNHGMFHPRKDQVVGTGYPILSELFQRDEYLTFQSCSNHRKTPAHGYAKGFDRSVFKYQSTLGELIDNVFGQLRAFPDRDHFVWLSVFDAHSAPGLTLDISTQTALPLEAQNYEEQAAKSPLATKCDPRKTARYIEELKRVDFYLGRLFDYINNVYEEGEFLVSLVSDHGTSSATANPELLSRERTHIAFMVRGGNAPQGRCQDFVQNTDILPSILHLADVPFDVEINGRLPMVFGGNDPRNYAVTEIMYPGTFREVGIKDDTFDFYLKSQGAVDDKGDFEMGTPETFLYKANDTSKELSDEYPEIVEKYTSVATKHMQGP